MSGFLSFVLTKEVVGDCRMQMIVKRKSFAGGHKGRETCKVWPPGLSTRGSVLRKYYKPTFPDVQSYICPESVHKCVDIVGRNIPYIAMVRVNETYGTSKNQWIAVVLVDRMHMDEEHRKTTCVFDKGRWASPSLLLYLRNTLGLTIY